MAPRWGGVATAALSTGNFSTAVVVFAVSVVVCGAARPWSGKPGRWGAPSSAVATVAGAEPVATCPAMSGMGFARCDCANCTGGVFAGRLCSAGPACMSGDGWSDAGAAESTLSGFATPSRIWYWGGDPSGVRWIAFLAINGVSGGGFTEFTRTGLAVSGEGASRIGGVGVVGGAVGAASGTEGTLLA